MCVKTVNKAILSTTKQTLLIKKYFCGYILCYKMIILGSKIKNQSFKTLYYKAKISVSLMIIS